MAENNNTGKILAIFGAVAAVGVGIYLLLKPKSSAAAKKSTALTPAQIAKIRTATTASQMKKGVTSPATLEQAVQAAVVKALSKQTQKNSTAPTPPNGSKTGGGVSTGGGSSSGGGAPKAANKPSTRAGQPVSTEDVSKGIDSVNKDGSVDYNDGYTLDKNGTLVDETGAVIATGVDSYDPYTGNIDFNGGSTLTGGGVLYDANDNVIGTNVDSFDPNTGNIDFNDSSTLTGGGVLYDANDNVIGTNVDSFDPNTGNIDFNDGSTLTGGGVLYDANDNVIGTNVDSFDPNTGNIDFSDGRTLAGDGTLYDANDNVIGVGVDSVNADGSIDYADGTTMDANGNLYDANDNLIDQSGELPTYDLPTPDNSGGDLGGDGMPSNVDGFDGKSTKHAFDEHWFKRKQGV